MSSTARATDWQIGAQDLVALADDKGLFPPYYVAPVVRQQVLDANPKVAGILDSLGSHLDNATMRVLNAKVENDHEEAKDVAEAFLKEKGCCPDDSAERQEPVLPPRASAPIAGERECRKSGSTT